MNQEQIRKYVVFTTLESHSKMYPSVTSKLLGYDENLTLLSDNNSSIKTIKECIERGVVGTATNKGEVRSDLIKKTLYLGGKVENYGKIIGNMILAKSVHYTESDLSRGNDSELSDKAQNVYAKAKEYKKELEAYGVDVSKIEELKVTIDKFVAVVPATRISKTTMAVYNDELKQLFKANDELLAKMDLLVEMGGDKYPDFYREYKINRKPIMKGGSSLSLMGRVTNAHDGAAVNGATVTIVLKSAAMAMSENADVTVKTIVKKTSAKGGFRIKNLPPGTYLVTIEQVGYAPKTVEINVTGSDLAKLNVKLERL